MNRVAHFIDSLDPGGAETVVVDVCRGMAPFGFECEVVHFGNEWLQAACRKHGITEITAPGYARFRSLKSLPFFAVEFARFIRSRKIDLLHSHLFGAIEAGGLAAWLARVPHLGTIHDTYTLEERPGRVVGLRVVRALGTKLIVISEHMRRYIAGVGRFAPETLRVLHNGCEVAQHLAAQDGIRRDLGIREDDVVFVCVGRLVDIKRHDVLLEAFRMVSSSLNARLLIVGDGPERERLHALIAEKSLAGTALLLGHREDVSRVLGAADCFVLASDSEGLSCSIIEAMAAGLPIVATRVGGNDELVEEGRNGYLVPPADPSALASRIARIAGDRQERAAFGAHSRNRARECFSRESMLRGYAGIYLAMTSCGKGKA